MARELRNIGASVRARLLARARVEQTDFQILLARCALERLLYRLSVSDQCERFVPKDAVLFAIWQDDPFRPTRDLDLLGNGDPDPAPLGPSSDDEPLCRNKYLPESAIALPLREKPSGGPSSRAPALK